ncbi:MAG: hypothetical protein HY097_04180 [Nitrospinae bacterium]|nr:hypothetical protein [Nitrospinota bacterium]
MRKHLLSLMAVIVLILSSPHIGSAEKAGSSLFYWEINLFQGYSRNDGWTGTGPNELKKSIGVEDYRRFSGDYGDWLVTDLQIRLTYNSNIGLNDALDLEIHNAYARFKLLYGRADIWVGHWEPAFGQESQIDTYPDILETLYMKNIGFKQDWGIGVRGAFPWWDYKITATNGSGMGIQFEGNYLFAGRIGIGDPSFDNYNLGFSALYGKTIDSMGKRLVSSDTPLKRRIGIDVSLFYGSFELRGEAVYGTEDEKDVAGTWARIYYFLTPDQKWRMDMQYQNWYHNLNKKGVVDSAAYAETSSAQVLGFSYKLNAPYLLRIYYAHDIEGRTGKEDDKVMFQLYYYYPDIRGITNLQSDYGGE